MDTELVVKVNNLKCVLCDEKEATVLWICDDCAEKGRISVEIKAEELVGLYACATCGSTKGYEKIELGEGGFQVRCKNCKSIVAGNVISVQNWLKRGSV